VSDLLAAASLASASLAAASLVTAQAHVDFLPPAERAALLTRWAERLQRGKEGLATAITAATGKPIRLARLEVDRAVGTVHETAKRLAQLMPLPVDLGDSGRADLYQVPLGPVLAITPFNFPLNLAVHKLAPALLAGCPVLWKPSPKAPGVAEAALDHLLHAGAETGIVQVVHLSDAEVLQLAADPRLAVLTFTGSTAVGHLLQKAASRAQTVLELGGSAAVILHQVHEREVAARQVAHAACAHAGQVCIAVQRILTTHDHEAWRDALVAAFTAVPTGDPWDDHTICGPVIDDAAKARITAELAGMVSRGGRILCGGTWQGRTLAPTLIAGLPASDPALRDRELFAPIAALIPARDIDDALTIAEDTPFGLNAGLYARDETVIATAFARLSVGTLVINDVPTRRDDRLPYGGVKASGCGREGALAALAHYTTSKVLWRAG
jgi:aldehyde dehydrogenase (NAD+)